MICQPSILQAKKRIVNGPLIAIFMASQLLISRLLSIAGKPHEVKHSPITTHAQATATRKAEKEAGMPQGSHHASVVAARRKK